MVNKGRTLQFRRTQEKFCKTLQENLRNFVVCDKEPNDPKIEKV